MATQATTPRPSYASEYKPPEPLPAESPIDLPPDGIGYRLKRRLLGPPLHTEQLEHERLGKPTALAVFASDNLSSSAYATEEILRVLVPAVGVAAFSLVVPITVAMLVVLAFLILSYRQTIKAYPTAGGAYMVTRDNFGLMPAQVAGVALLTDYVLTVAVSVAAGTAALVSAVSGAHRPTPCRSRWRSSCSSPTATCAACASRAGSSPCPTYFFIASMVVLLGLGPRPAADRRPADRRPQPGGPARTSAAGGSGLLMGASVFVVLHAFASGGAAVTGVEAISNGVPAFRKPEWKNARTTLVIMGSLLGVMFLGLSILGAPHAGRTVRRGHADGDLPDRRAGLRRQPARAGRSSTPCRPARCSSSSSPPTPASPTSPGSPASTPATTSCPASSPSAATGSCSPTASSSSPASPSSS